MTADARHPREIVFHRAGGRRLVVPVADDPALRERLACLVDADDVPRRHFEFPPLPGAGDRELDRHRRLNEALADRFAADRPRTLVPNVGVFANAGLRVHFFEQLMEASAGRTNLIFYPQRTRSTRKLCDCLYDMLRCRPDVLVLGAGMEDGLVETASGLPLVDLDEFQYRLEWVLRTARADFGARAVYLLNGPAGESVDDRRGFRFSADAARPYLDAARRIVGAHEGRAVDLGPVLDGPAPSADRRPAIATTIADLVTAAVVGTADAPPPPTVSTTG